jgi:hypothetical protein
MNLFSRTIWSVQKYGFGVVTPAPHKVIFCIKINKKLHVKYCLLKFLASSGQLPYQIHFPLYEKMPNLFKRFLSIYYMGLKDFLEKLGRKRKKEDSNSIDHSNP